MENINFQPVFDYIDEAEKRIKTEIMEKVASKKDIEDLQNHIDFLAKQTKDAGDKAAVADAKANKVERWVIQAAEKVNLPYQA